MKNRTILILALFVAACGAPPMDAPVGDTPPDAVPTPDAIAPALDAGTHTEAATPEAAPPTPEAGAPAPEAATPEAAPPVPDAGTTAPDSAPAGDAGTDAAPPPICTAPSASCAAANQEDARVRATFPIPCTPEGFRQCGGVRNGTVVETIPLLCRMGEWRLAGSQVGNVWVVAYQCSAGCAEGKLCAP